MKHFKRIAVTTGIVCALAPATAMASSSTSAYGGPGVEVRGLTEGSGTAGTNSKSREVKTANAGGSLPFTGADLGVVAGAGALLLGMGVGLRRLTYRPSSLS